MRIRQMHVGEDILLARHGHRIERLKVDRRANTVFATLDDGSWDYASNVIFVPPVAKDKESGFTAADGKFLARLIAGWAALSAVLMIVSMNVAGSLANAGLLDPATMYVAY